jgi:hypothetical protein
MRVKSLAGVVVFFVATFAAASAEAALPFDKAEYAARRAKVMEAVRGGVAVVLGAQQVPGYDVEPLRLREAGERASERLSRFRESAARKVLRDGD